MALCLGKPWGPCRPLGCGPRPVAISVETVGELPTGGWVPVHGTTRASKDCALGLRAHCRDQTQGGLQDVPLCSCYLSSETYANIQAEANRSLAQGSQVVQLINEVLQKREVPSDCWYDPCHNQDNRSATTCPGGDVYACVQISADNTYAGGGSNAHLQQCNIKNEPGAKGGGGNMPAAGAGGGGSKPDAGGQTGGRCGGRATTPPVNNRDPMAARGCPPTQKGRHPRCQPPGDSWNRLKTDSAFGRKAAVTLLVVAATIIVIRLLMRRG